MNCAWNACDPIGLPKIRNPFTSSYGWLSFFEYLAIASSICSHNAGLCCRRVGIIDSEFVDVRMRVLSVFITAPKGTPISSNCCRRYWTSSKGTRQLVSSTYAVISAWPPLLSSITRPSANLCLALSPSLMLIFLKMCVNTMPAKRGEKGHPWVKPSSTIIVCQLLSRSLYIAWWVSL